jgi:sulfur carrier protein
MHSLSTDADRQHPFVPSSRGGSLPVKIILNGEPLELAEPMSLTALLGKLEIDPRRVAVEHNLTVVKRGAYDGTEVRDGDQIEIVNFVGGG